MFDVTGEDSDSKTSSESLSSLDRMSPGFESSEASLSSIRSFNSSPDFRSSESEYALASGKTSRTLFEDEDIAPQVEN